MCLQPITHDFNSDVLLLYLFGMHALHIHRGIAKEEEDR